MPVPCHRWIDKVPHSAGRNWRSLSRSRQERALNPPHRPPLRP
ncbi:MAG: hypothetical protein PVTTEEND_001908, partial [Candidatus Fervidibacter sp.]